MTRSTQPAGINSPTGSEFFTIIGKKLVRHVEYGSLRLHSSIDVPDELTSDLKGDWWRAYLRGAQPVPAKVQGRMVRMVDLFCGPGGLANGVSQFLREAGYWPTAELAVDQDAGATGVYSANHRALSTSTDSVSNLVDFAVRNGTGTPRFHYQPELTDSGMAATLMGVDMVLAGPPCQGHSNLNNHTRRNDPRNSLYLTVPAFAVAIQARVVIIENVPAVLHDSTNVVGQARSLLEGAGYTVVSGTVNAAALGWPQTRKRHFLVARLDTAPIPLEEVTRILGDREPRSIWWAIADLEDTDEHGLVDQVADVSAENQSRMNWLFDNDAHELALPERPLSHRNGTTYMSVYGRMRRDEPAPTITTGFMSPGRGRFVHPTRPRVLTPREAARLQGFPDTYKFVVDSGSPPGKTQLAKWIGDAVPMPLGFAAAFSAIASDPF